MSQSTRGSFFAHEPQLDDTAAMLTINIGVPFFVCLLAAIIFLLCTPAGSPRTQDVKELAKHAFWCGLLVTLFVFATTHVRF